MGRVMPVAISTLAVLFILKVLLDGFFNPLRHIPGPWYSRFTSIPHLSARASGSSLTYTKKLHLHYGPVVRLAPESVSVNSIDSFYQIHNVGSNFQKTPIFDRIRFSHSPMLFTMRDQKLHAERRRMLGRAFAAARTGLDASVANLVRQAVDGIKCDAIEGHADVYKWWRCLAVDVIATMSFGKPLGMLRDQITGQESPILVALENANQRVVLGAVMPPVFFEFLKWSPTRHFRNLGWAREVMFNAARAAVKNLQNDSLDGRSIFGQIIATFRNGLKGTLDEDNMSSEAAMMMVAGSDSTAATLTYAVWEVLKRPDLQRRLEDEVKSLEPNFVWEDVEPLPLLRNVVEETLRLYNPAGAPAERLVPSSGASIHGWDLPGGTTVFTQLWLLSRDDQIFPGADRFDETRFEKLTSAQKRAHVPFSIGSRSCIGMYLARMELKIALALFFRECRGARLGQHMTDVMMAQTGEFFIVPQGGRCDIFLPEGRRASGMPEH
ncbi:cytochrome P450 [Thozetella sp. PMI_491]|nr:cytochrome P450 [Thozetella sp. PMI_491]